MLGWVATKVVCSGKFVPVPAVPFPLIIIYSCPSILTGGISSKTASLQPPGASPHDPEFITTGLFVVTKLPKVV